MRQRKKLFNSILSFILILTMVAGNLTVAKAENNIYTPELITLTDENGVEFTKTAYWVDATGKPVEYASEAMKDDKGNPIAEVKLRVNGANLDLKDNVIHEGAADVVIILDTSNSMQWDGICYQNGEEKRTFSYNATATVYEIKKINESTWTEVTEDEYNEYTDNLGDSNYVYGKRKSGIFSIKYEIKKTENSDWTRVSKKVYDSSVTDVNKSNYVLAKQTYTKTVTKNVNTTVDEFFNSSQFAGARYGTTGMNFTDSRIYYAKNKLFNFTKTLLNASENVNIAFVAFHNSVSATVGFSQYTDYNALNSKITALKTDGGTNPAPALEKAKALLELKGGDAEKIVVYIGDGATSNSSYQTKAIAKAKELKNAGITIYSVGYCIEDGTSTDSSAKAFIKALASGDNYFMSASMSDNDASVDLGIILERIQKIITNEAGEASVVDAIPNYFKVIPSNNVTSNMLEDKGDYTELTWKVNSLVQSNVFTYRMTFDKSYLNQVDSIIDSHKPVYNEGTATALLSYSLIQKTNGEQTDAKEYKTGLGNLKLKVDTNTYTIHYMVDDVENSTIKLDHIKALKNDRVVIYNKADQINLGAQDINYKVFIDSGSIALSDATEANGIASFIILDDSEITVNYKTKYTISFETSHGTAPESVSVKMGNSYTLDNSVNITTEDDFVLEGWKVKDSSDDAKYSEGSEVGGGTEDITFIAVWIPTYGVTYDSNGGTPNDISDNADYRAGDNVTVTAVEPTRDDDIFNGWNYNGVLYQSGDLVTMPEVGITFIADWTTRYEVTFYLDGILLDQYTKHVVNASQITDPLNEIAQTLDSSKELISTWTIPTSINGDIQLYAESNTKVFTANYWYGDVNTGILIDSQTVEYGDSVTPVVGVVSGSAITTGPAIVFMKNNKIIQTVECTDAVGVDFTGFQVAPENANVERVTSNLDFYSSATKYYSITYLVDGKEVQRFSPIQEGTVLTEEFNFNYTVPEGKKFSGWSQKLPQKLTGNLVITATTADKLYTVTFTDAQGTITESNVLWGANLNAPDPRTKADETGKKEDGSAYWYKFTPEQWKPVTANATYTINDLSSVQQNMDFVVKYQKNEVYTKYYVLKRGLAQPDELNHYPIPNYSKGVIGNLKEFKEIANDDSAVQSNLVNEPNGNKFTDITLKEGEFIRWYVVKQEVDNWHVDGIIINQKANYKIEYVDIDTMEELGRVEKTIVDDFSGVQVAIIDGVPYVNERAVQFNDYQYHSAKNDKITLTAGDLYVDGNNTITLYFRKNAPTVSYIVRYLCNGEDIAPKKVVNNRNLGEIVEEHAIDIKGYILNDLDTKTLELANEANEITFVYKKSNEVTPTPTPNPITPTPDPVTPTPNPVTPTPDPVTPTPNPVTPTPDPVTPTPNPVTPTPDPVTPTPNPVTPTPDPVTPTPTIIPDTPTPTPTPTPTIIPDEPTPTSEPDDPSPTPTDKPDNPTPTITIVPTVTPISTITPMPTEEPELVIEDEDTPLGNADGNSLDPNEMNELVIADEKVPLGNGELPKTGTANEIVIYMLGIAFVILGSTVVIIDKKKKCNGK